MTLENTIREIIARNLEIKCEITSQSRLIDDLGVDSFTMLMIVDDIEEEFSIVIDENNFSGLEKVADISERLIKDFPEVEGGRQ
ncbi:MAG: acyl carrier protein [Proteobacteria bacterium]|nr:acyl carrier protein [Pseudomonadota bacterium]MBU1689069.1 acyl carrier protein [Pseudomonadota bacterium]